MLIADGMVARSFRELDAWKLASDLRRQIVPMLKAPPVARDRRFCDQISDSSESVHRNIAEGFGRYNPAEFARFLGIARASLDETEDSLRAGVERQYFEAQRTGELIRLAARCRWAINGLQSYLFKAAKSGRFKNRSRN